jgi:hypothetical protein
MNYPKYAIPLLIAVTMLACAPTRVFMKTYDGAPLPEEQAALLKPVLAVSVKAIDGDETKTITPLRPGNPTNIDADISFRPGRHTILVGYYIMEPAATYWSNEDQIVEFEARANHRYLLKGERRGESWRPIIEDVTNEPNKWCWSEWDCRSGPSKPMPKEKIR